MKTQFEVKRIFLALSASMLMWACNEPSFEVQSDENVVEVEDSQAVNPKLSHINVKQDNNPFGITEIRTYERRGKNSGTFKVDGLREGQSVISLQWTFNINDKEEVWHVIGRRLNSQGMPVYGELVYGTVKEQDRLSSDARFVEVFKWFFEKDQQAVAYPGWIGEFSFTAKTEYGLITIDDCVPCDTPFCTC